MTPSTARAASLLLAAYTAFGQTAAPPPSFDVASVKPTDPSRHAIDLRVFPGGRLRIANLTLRDMIRWAYSVKNYHLTGGPAWFDTDRFDIDAKAEGDATQPQVMAMLQTLLVDRFHLKVRRETLEGNIYVLVVAKGGPKLKPPSATESYVHLFREEPADVPGVHYTIAGQKASVAKPPAWWAMPTRRPARASARHRSGPWPPFVSLSMNDVSRRWSSAVTFWLSSAPVSASPRQNLSFSPGEESLTAGCSSNGPCRRRAIGLS